MNIFIDMNFLGDTLIPQFSCITKFHSFPRDLITKDFWRKQEK
uniref:Uncharacterized protein n=1 Tax=Rhizophora mucronata TaxID=61149 RepID=A0A2P2LLF8_RHIMU